MNQWLTLFTSVGVGSVLAVLFQGLFAKRKLSAEATKVITGAAAEVVEIQKAELARLFASNTLQIGQLAAQQIQIDELKRDVRATSDALAVHAFWDRQVVAIAAANNIDLPPPPPLTTGS